MKVITRHLTKEILQATGFVLLAIVALFAFFDLVRQMERIAVIAYWMPSSSRVLIFPCEFMR